MELMQHIVVLTEHLKKLGTIISLDGLLVPGAVAYGTRVKGKGAAAAVPDLQAMRTAAPTSGIF